MGTQIPVQGLSSFIFPGYNVLLFVLQIWLNVDELFLTFFHFRISLLQMWKISWTKVKENGANVESISCTYSVVPEEESR